MEFKPVRYIAKCCGYLIWSEYSGQYKSCPCGKSFVDQTEDYIRIGGESKSSETIMEDLKRKVENGSST